MRSSSRHISRDIWGAWAARLPLLLLLTLAPARVFAQAAPARQDFSPPSAQPSSARRPPPGTFLRTPRPPRTRVVDPLTIDLETNSQVALPPLWPPLTLLALSTGGGIVGSTVLLVNWLPYAFPHSGEPSEGEKRAAGRGLAGAAVSGAGFLGSLLWLKRRTRERRRLSAAAAPAAPRETVSWGITGPGIALRMRL